MPPKMVEDKSASAVKSLNEPKVVVSRTATFSATNMIEAVNTAYPDIKVPANATVDYVGGIGFVIKWDES